LISYCALAHGVKTWFIGRYGYQWWAILSLSSPPSAKSYHWPNSFHQTKGPSPL
jgi:hypothetical protein